MAEHSKVLVTFAVAPSDGRPARLVIAHYGEHEIFRDMLDVCSSEARSRLAEQIARQLQMCGEHTAYLVRYCHATLPALADAADEQAELLARQGGTMPPTRCYAMRKAWHEAINCRRRLITEG